MNRIEVNVMTGEKTIIDLTPEEEQEALDRTAAEQLEMAARKKRVSLDELVEALKVKINLTDAELAAVKK